MVHMSQEDIDAYRLKKEEERAKAHAEAQKTTEQKAKEQAKQRRIELEASLKARWLANGGTETEWFGVKKRLIENALIAQTLAPEPEVEEEKPVAPAPHPKSFYRQ